jgi:IS1 family transposase
MDDVRDRVDSQPQFSTDGWRAYGMTIPTVFGSNVDHAQIVKKFATTTEGSGAEKKYSPPACISCELKVVSGNPDLAKATTSHIERFNLANRTMNRRFARLTLGHSKRLSNHEYSIALSMWGYNWVKVHSTIKTTPAVAAGIAAKPMNWVQFVVLMEEEEERLGRRITDYIPSAKPDGVE